MTNQRSPLDNLNMRRERRPLASLEELNRTLSALENHLAGRQETENYPRHTQAADETASPDALEFLRTDPVAASHTQTAPVSADNPHKEALAAIADELQRLRARTELRQAAAISEKLQPSETGTRHNPARLSAADRFIAGTSTLSANNSPNTDAVMRRDFEELKRTVETLAREESLRRMSHRWDALDERFDNFEQQQTEKFHASQSAHIDPALDAITTRLDDLRHAIEQLPDNQSHSLRQLDERLDEISRAILATSYHRQQPEQENAVFEELDRRFADLTSHLDEQYRNSAHKTALNDDRFIQALESRLDLITRQVSEQTAALQAVPAAPAADQQLMRNLEKQLGFITEQLSKPESLLPELAEIKPRLDVIERAIDINRDTVLSAAREAAEEAIRQVVDKGSSRDTDFARQLADDLKALEQLTRDTDERNNRTFNKVHDTLLKIAERLGQIEKDNLQKPPFAQPSRSAGQSREQNNATRFTSQFSIPEWGNDPEQAAGNSPRNTAFSAVPSPAAAAIEAARAAVKSAANPVPGKMAADTEAETTGTTRKSLLSGLAQAVRRSKPNGPAAAAADAFQIEDTDLLTLDTPSAANRMPVKSEEESTDQTLAAMPDLNAIIRRVRDEQRGRGPDHNPAAGKSDLISAARRAAQAAADETGRLRDQNLSDSTLAGDITSDEDRTTAADKPKRSLRKPLLLAIGAIIIAVTGLQLGNIYLTEKQDSVVPQSPDLASVQPAPVNTAPAVIEDKKPALPTITTLDNPAQSEEQTASTLQITSLNHGPVYDGTEAQPLGSREFPTEPLSARPMTGSTQAVIKPVVINPPVASAPDIQPLPELPANGTPVDTAQAETAIPDQMTTQSLPQKSEAAATAKLTAAPAVPKEAGPIALRNAAESGDARALYEIGMRYTDGRGVASDFAEAAKWYALSAERGFAPAQYRLANFNEKGLGMPRDAAKATQLYEQSAAQGNASAMHNLAVLYAMGPDGKADHDNAAKWFFRAAELGVKDSQYNLGILTAKGLGRTQNLEESYKWFALAANAGDTDAADKRDQIAKSLKPEQLERAINLTKLWKPKDMIEDANSVSIPDAWADDKAVTTASVDMKKAVRNIQLILQKNGYDAGTADGVMGNKTREAISAFQKANGMKPTGEVDQKLVEALLAKNS
ncbi:peptidoglycan-binding protein [Ochrobactrum sp. SFR4]|uniref:peptidoglycan-binding protein n=1 Tax=Ochrobactrum sp. SFR4 TaxID=2717368 RepID=UPI001C8C4CB1|nr:peptidoglycan-binding protein [Ochrobactrum sp. SFR4]MBX8825834.1 peptidoglycan-binding protein [Ochrobactrum sp. SFR4]